MPNAHARNTDKALLHPVVRAAVTQIEAALNAEGIPFRIFEAFRFPQRQADLFAQGRTRPGKKVTYAEPWRSYHQYGLAVDFVLFENGQWSWDNSPAKKKCWDRLHELGKQHGLTPLNFEIPHLQLLGTSSNALIQGHYPAGGDEQWAENLAAVIAGWAGSQVPPSPEVPVRPVIVA